MIICVVSICVTRGLRKQVLSKYTNTCSYVPSIRHKILTGENIDEVLAIHKIILFKVFFPIAT